MKITFDAISDRGLNPKRHANEDHFFALKSRGLFVVADGVGGRRGGQVASHTATDVFQKTFESEKREISEETLAAAIVECNRRIFEESQHTAELEGMATTIVVLSLVRKRAIVGHVGDSRLYRISNGVLKCETEDHSEVIEAVRAGLLTPAMAEHDPRRNVLTRAVGIEPSIEADFKTIALGEGERFLLCSDGITRHIPDSELEELLSSRQSPASLCKHLKDVCYSRGAEDNLTAVIVDVGTHQYVNGSGGLPKIVPAEPAGKRFRVDLSRTSAPADVVQPVLEAPISEKILRPRRFEQRRSPGWLWIILLGATAALIVVLSLKPGLFQSLVDQIGLRNTSPPNVVKTVETDPNFASVKVLIADGRYDKARDQLQTMVSNQPTNPDYRLWLGRSYLELKDYPEAIRELNESIKLDPSDHETFEYLARAYDGAGEREKARETRRNAPPPLPSSPLPQPTSESR